MRKCNVCGKRFTLSKEHVYQVSEPQPVTKMLVDAVKVYDVMDCPQCGCQMLLKVRMPKFMMGGANK